MELIIFLAVLAAVVLAHEWGHFFAARRFGVKVDEFGFGFPPRVWGKRFGKTLYSINLIPLGGFVRIFGEGGEGAADPESFASRKIWQRAVVIVAGVGMNLVLAWALFSVGLFIGAPALGSTAIEGSIEVTITSVAPGSPSEKAGLSFGNVIRKMRAGEDSITPNGSGDVIDFTMRHKGENIELSILPGPRAGDELIRTVLIEARSYPPRGQGPLGIALGDIGIRRVVWYEAPWEGAKSLWYTLEAISEAFFGLFQTAVIEQKVPDEVSGPIGLFVLTQQMSRLGIAFFIQFVAALSVNLAIFNIIPFPALDGGRLLFLAIEKVRGKPVHIKYEQLTHALGFALLIALVLFISYHDIRLNFL